MKKLKQNQFIATAVITPSSPTRTQVKGLPFLKAMRTMAATATIAISSPAQAGGIPVFDGVAISHAVIQINEMAKDYQAQLDQLKQSLDTYNSLSGERNIGDLLNSSIDKDLRRALPADLQDMIGLKSATNLSASGLKTQSIYNDLLTTFDPISGADLFTSEPSGSLAMAHDRLNNTTYAALAASQSSYNAASKRLVGYEALLDQLSSSHDLKQSVDLLARISVENGILMNELMKVQSLQMQLSAATQNQYIMNTRRIDNASTYNAELGAQAFQQPQ